MKSPKISRWRWSPETFDWLVDHGAFVNERVELVRGEVVQLEPHSLEHANGIEVAAEALCGCIRLARLRVQLPMVIGDERLVPDIAVVDKKLPKTEHPSTAHLVVEVADSSVRYDRIVKAPLTPPRESPSIGSSTRLASTSRSSRVCATTATPGTRRSRRARCPFPAFPRSRSP